MFLHKTRFVQYQDETITQIEGTSSFSNEAALKPTPRAMVDDGLVACLKATRVDFYKRNHLIHSLVGSFSMIKLVQNYLIAVNGNAIELYSTKTFSLQSSLTTSSPVWAIDASDDLLAVVSQNIQIYSLPGRGENIDQSHNLLFNYSIHFPHKALVIKLAEDSLYLSTDNSLLWNLTLEKNSTTISRVSLKKKSVVWDIALTKDYVITGDSFGRVMFFSRANLTMIQALKSHRADVLCLTVNPVGNTLFSSGIDRVIVQYKLLRQASAKDKWIIAGEKRYHSHDVKALLLQNGTLYSGGVDMAMVATAVKNFPNVQPKRQCPFPHKSIISLAPIKKIMMAQFIDMVKIWQLGSTIQNAAELSEDTPVPLQAPYKHLLDIKLVPGSLITCSSISPDASFVAISTTTEFKLFSLTFDDQGKVICKKVSSDIKPCSSMVFSSNSLLLITGALEHTTIYDMSTMKSIVAFPQTCIASSLSITDDSAWLVVCSLTSIQIYNVDTLKHHWTISTKLTITSMALSSTNKLFITLCDNMMWMYDIESKKLSSWSKENCQCIPDKFTGKRETIRGCFFIGEKVIMFGHSFFALLDLTIPLERKNNLKRLGNGNKKVVVATKDDGMEEVEEPQKIEKHGLSISYKFPSLLFMGIMGSELCVVERPILSMMENLPMSFSKKTYGT